MTASNALQQTAWLFTREGESVHLEVEDAETGVQLHVSGPGSQSSSYDFEDAESLNGFRTSYERDLLDRGFRLQAVAERRGGDERRAGSRESVTERRRSRRKADGGDE